MIHSRFVLLGLLLIGASSGCRTASSASGAGNGGGSDGGSRGGGGSYDVTATLKLTSSLTGAISLTRALTMHVAPTDDAIVVGEGGGFGSTPAQLTRDGWTATGAGFSFDLPCSYQDTLAGVEIVVTGLDVSGLSLQPTAGGVSGTMSGTASLLVDGDEQDVAPFTATLSGVADTTAPALAACSFNAASLPFPTDLIGLQLDEPLSPLAAAHLASDGAEQSPLPPLPAESGAVSGFATTQALAFGHRYQVVVDAFADLAGNPGDAAQLPSFTTPTVALAVLDGFEGDWSLSTQGAAAIVDATVLPPISGLRSLFIPMAAAVGARLPVTPGQTTLHASLRAVLPANQSSDGAPVAIVDLAAPFGAVQSMTIPLTTSATTEVPGNSAVELSATQSWSMPLPPGVTSEVMITIRASSPSFFGSPSAGLQIDDLRID